MSAPFVHFERLEIRSLPGLPPPGLVLESLSPGINVIYGPNASGKSRTAHALMLVLWPKGARRSRASLRARLRLDDERWVVDVDAGAFSSQRDGTEADLPPLPPFEAGDRYRLELHDLVSSRGGALAETIALESVGGYDIGRASSALGFRDGPSGSRTEADRHRTATAALNEARDRDTALLDEERSLARLRGQRDAARADQRRAAALELAIERASLAEQEADAGAALDVFPEGMEHIVGNEAEQLASRRTRIELLTAESRAHREERDEAREAVEASPLPDGVLPADTMAELREHERELDRADQAVDTQHGNLAKARAARNQARHRIGEAVTDEHLEQLDLSQLEDLSGFARRSQELRARLQAADAVKGWLGQPQPDPELDSVHKGVDLLRRWLREGVPAPPTVDPLWRGLLTVAGVALVAAVVAAATALGWWLLVFALVGAIPILFAWRSPPTPPSARQIHQRDFCDLDLAEPETWEEAGVKRRLRKLEGRLARAKVEEEREHRWLRKQDEVEELQSRQAEFDRQRGEIAERLGVDPGLDEQSLRWLVTNLIAWEEAATDAAVARSEWMEANARRGAELQAINGVLERLGQPAVEDARSAGRAVGELDRQNRRLERAIVTQSGAENATAAIDSQIADHAAQLRALFENVGLEVGDDVSLVDRCERRSAHRAARDRAAELRRDLQRAEQKLREHGGFEESLLQQPVDELQAARAELAGAAQREQEANDEIVRIADRVTQAKQAHAVEAALAAQLDARDALAERRDADRLAVSGGVLADWLYEQSRDRDRPVVFHRARELLLAITRGRYRLDIEDGKPPQFRAFDTESERGLALEELSSGTRVQLLLAVRVAFVETLEQGARPPLVLDEALANSDDARARAIIEATLELARAGRQVFYFTAQHDEVGKWRGVLAGVTDVDHRLIDLHQVRRLAEAEAVDELPRIPPPAEVVEEPAGLSYQEYGRALGVPPIEPRGPIGAVHLWHLLDDPSALHRLLSAGIERWGPLQQLLASGGAPLLGDDSRAVHRLEAAVHAVRAVCEQWRIGRGRPVDRQALVDTGAVTPKPLPRVAAMAAEVEGDARALVQRLETEKIPGMGAVRLQRLRDRLEEHGYLDSDDPLTREEIRAIALGALAREVTEGLIDAAFLDRTLANLLTTAPSRRRSTGSRPRPGG